MKRIFAYLFLIFSLPGLYSAGVKVKGTVTFGSSIVESSEEGFGFAGAYALGNISAENKYLTAAGKIYYRLNATDNVDELGQKLEIKRAFVKVRPFGTDNLEFAGGKLYSYYLPGNYFGLSEIYTGGSRWGKTGTGIFFNVRGFSGGAAIPLTESYVAFKKDFGVNAALVYDFAYLNEKIPVKFGADFLFDRARQKDESYVENYTSTVSAFYTPEFKGFFSKFSVAASFSYNAEPYVASSVFKNVANYAEADLKKADFVSLNLKSKIGNIDFTLEAEAGHSKEGSLIPLYAGTQFLIPVVKHFDLKPRFFYYAALDKSDSDKSRQTFEFYPRVWLSFGSWIISAGYDFAFKQTEKNSWEFLWKIPAYVEFKF